MEGGKKTKGRQKIPIKKIENANERQVTFCKRKSGVIKKASEMSTLTGAHVGLVIFSEAGKPYSFGSPSIESVAGRFLPELQNQNQISDDARAVLEANRQARVDGILRIHNDLESKLKEDRDRAKELRKRERARTSKDQGGPGWWEKPMEGLELAELKQMHSSYERLQNDLSSYLKSTASAGGSSSSAGATGIPPGTLPARFGLE
ncbi:agamous-like MADS-box protein AGL61 [Rosa rugosa]|uniref:agamous-like MADS-box protein AGL61 n=1 Tax=Rosa rugosa TaxID=74645 RepID=UPI002B416A37|nr:agamous-like MADS-box protein AGL61 [Rosa rugosa]